MAETVTLKQSASEAWTRTFQQAGGIPGLLFIGAGTFGVAFILQRVLEKELRSGVWEDAAVSLFVFLSVVLVLFLWNFLGAPSRLYRLQIDTASAEIVTLRQQVRELTPKPVMPPPPEPPDVVNAKQALANFVAGPLTTADTAAREAVRLSAYAFNDAWKDHPAGKLGWAGILRSQRPPDLIPKLSDPAMLRWVSLDEVQKVLVRAIVEYRTRVHKLNEVVSGLIEHDRLRDFSGFFDRVRAWKAHHDDVVAEFEALRQTAQFGFLREARNEVYVVELKSNLEVFDEILNSKGS